jgi:hypothetical protein
MQFGSDSKRIIPQAVNGILDDSGNVVVSGDTCFGASPLGSAARSQALYGIANANFNLTPNIPENPIVDGSNPLPFWSADDLSEGRITATMFYNETDQTWAVELNPTAGSASDAFTLTTRSYLLNDSGISLRQKAFATLSKVGTYAGSNQWNLVLSASYYDLNGTQLSTFAIGTAADNATWTGINGFTTSGTAVVSASAQYVDLALTLTCAANVSGTATVQAESLLIQTSTTGGGGGASSFIIADTFSASGSWVRPAGVDYLIGVVVAGAGGGGGGGSVKTASSFADNRAGGGGGGGSGRWTFLPNLYVGDVGTVSVGIGAGGAGGTARSFTKATSSSTTASLNGGAGAAGATTTFGSFISVLGAGGGGAGTANGNGGVGGTAAGTVTTTVFGITNLPGTAGASGAAAGTASETTQGFTTFPYHATYVGSSGGSAIGNGAASLVVSAGGAGGSAGVCGSGAGANNPGQTTFGYTSTPTGFAGGWGNGAGSGGGVHCQRAFGGTSTIGTAGNGGAGTALGGSSGGGGGGACFLAFSNNYTDVAMTLQSGAGGKGSDGFVSVIYVA